MPSEELITLTVDISNEERDWAEVIPDQWFYADHVRGREVALKIKSVETEQTGEVQKPYLTFENDEKRLGLNRENRQVLRALFGTPAKTKGQWITITAMLSRGSYVIKILPRVTVEPTVIQEELPPKKRKPRAKRNTEE